jgi:hypothetical protein
VLRIDRVSEFHLRLEKISDTLPVEGRNSPQDHLGLPSGRLVPDQLKAALPDSCEDTCGCTSRVEARRDEHIGVDYNPSHMTTLRKPNWRENPSNSLFAALVWFGWQTIREAFKSVKDESNIPILRMGSTIIKGMEDIRRSGHEYQRRPSK